MAYPSLNLCARAILALSLLLGLSACGNTIRGVGKDIGGVVDATQDAGRNVANSVK
ncbi:entericidin B signal peptide protein [Rhizobium wuzhouense]|uniref:Entericidin B signal peptide protein n=1 Tax=Rhizobium wuzhouense TaxID=1986026 RepID=A0ABX5NV56_9HYPH|nr:entericidin B signal peptide protein [Rhizobium wuzhouense]PYB75093.1 entericidin B signal peptide protein [Rhizobium wuzhouense]